MPSAAEPRVRRRGDRRQRVIRAALELASSGGYDAVQMRDVATRADVALGTIYHHFSSKDHLLAATLVEWAQESLADAERHPPTGPTTLDRMLGLLARTTSAMRTYDLLSAAVIRGFTSPGDDVAACQREVHEVFRRTLTLAFDRGADPVWRDRVIRTLEHVWYSGLIGWTNGWLTLDQAIAELDDAARLLLDGR